MGRRLDIHSLPRNDGRVFSKMSLPNETPELAIALLLDESGSMSCGSRATYARASAVILYDFCQSLGIPVMVYGHSTDSGVALYSYAEFDSIDKLDRYRMMDISDGATQDAPPSVCRRAARQAPRGHTAVDTRIRWATGGFWILWHRR
jgi:cobalamin biosynthesis protein CobT